MPTATEHVYIVRDDQILGGEPIIKGTRTPVRAIVETWPITAGQKNSPMALDGANHRLLVVTRTPPRLVVLDSTSGKQVASLPSATGTCRPFRKAGESCATLEDQCEPLANCVNDQCVRCPAP